MTGAEAEDAARLLERLLTDEAFREQFRANPVAASREAGLESVAQEMAMSTGKAMQTLDDRESRSSLAGVFMAAALEGVGVYDFSRDFVPHLDGIPEQVEQVLSRVHSHGGLSAPAGFADLGVPAAAAADAPPAPPNAAGEFPAITPEQAAGRVEVPAQLAQPPAPEPADAATGDTPPGASGDGGEDDSDSDDPSDDQENDENSPEGDDGSDSGSDGSDSGDSGDSGDSSDSSAAVGDGAQVDVADVDASYPSDSAPRARIAAWMGSQAQKRGLPAELPVMAALVESDMHNLRSGDADSVGYFQMRAGTWNQGEYAGYPDRAQLQLKWFLDQAEAVKRQRVAAGQPVDDPNGYGEWIADIERPKAEYRGRYQLHLDEARGLLRQRAEGGNDQGSGDADLAVEAVAQDDGDGAGPRALEAVAEVRKQLGTPYLWGGSSPSTGFDCSGLVQWAYAKAGIVIPRTSEQQILASNGRAVDRGHLRPGDLVFFRDAGGDVHHVGISLGGDKFINAPHTGAKVRVNDLSEPYYAGEFAGGRRFDLSAAGASGTAPADSSGLDQAEVRRAQAALARDAAEAQRPGTLLFEAVSAQELRKAYHAQTTVDPNP